MELLDINQHVDLTQIFQAKLVSKQIIQKKEQTNQFLLTTSIVKERIDQANTRLQQFQQMSSQAGLFNDQDYKLNNILTLVKEDLDWINAQLNHLKNEVNNRLNQSIHDFLQSQTIKISDFFKKVKKQIQYSDQVLQAHTQKMKQQEEKRNKFGGERDRVIKRGGYTQKYQKLQEEEHQVIQMQIDQKESQQKLSSMRKIEEMLNEVATVFQRVGTMVRMQESMVDRIDKYTDDSLVNVQKGRKELQEAHKRLSQNRGLILKIFLILFIFSFIYIVFIL